MSTEKDGQFRGRFEIKADAKFRLTLPSSFRDFLGSDCRMVITNSQYQGAHCLDAYTFAQWKKLEQRIAKLPQLKIEVQNFQRFYLSGGHPVEMDNQGRILVPPLLRNYAHIQSEVVIVGFAHKFEIWAQDVWAKLFETLTQDFSQTLAAVANLEQGDND